MKGISPVITTVLLLLLAVGAVGGSWIFIQQLSSKTQASGAGQFENVKSQASVIMSIESATVTSNVAPTNDTLTIKIANPTTTDGKITRLVVKNATGASIENMTTTTIIRNDFTDIIVVVDNAEVTTFCPQTNFVKITAYSDSFVVIRDFPAECKY